jgi:ferredoxin
MKCVVIYFSQTGSTEKVARAIQKGVQEAAGNCDIMKIKEANPRHLFEYDLIGIGSRCPEIGFAAPGHGDMKVSTMLYDTPEALGPSVPKGGQVPMNVELFINNMRYVGGKHAFVFSTHGGIPEYFFPTIVPMLNNQGLKVIGTADWYGNAYLPWHAEPYPTAGHPDKQDLEGAEDFGREMVDRSKTISAGNTKLIPPVPQTPPPMPLAANPAWDLNHWYFKFHSEKCLYPQCRLCMDNCPMDGIDLSLDPPVFALPCQKHCSFCTMICPTGALEADEYEKQTPNYLRLQREIILPRLAKQEKEGNFRRLIPEEKVSLEVSFGMIHKKHPKWIIGVSPNPE